MRNILVTGGNDGIGKAAALLLAGEDSSIILIGRNRDRGAAAEREVQAAGGSAKFLPADLSTVSAMRAVAAEVAEEMEHLDAIVHAAGGVFSQRRHLTEEGLEQTFVIQTLARFVLTQELAERLHQAATPRVVLVAGGGGPDKELDLSDLQGERTHSFFGSMMKNAAANNLLTLALQSHHAEIEFFNYGPGLVRTKVSMSNPLMKLALSTVGRFFSRSPEEAGADVAALLSGTYPAGFYGPGPKPNDPSRLRANPGLSEGFWDYCHEIVDGIR
jgi:NAD(P)-dependent dehydrogenase (short-subunit alcohol dehydrogenase family)